MREAAIKNRILLALAGLQDTMTWNAPCGTFRAFDDPGRVIRVGPAGRADLLGCRKGRAFAIEVKTATGRLRREQELWAAAFGSVGGTWILARSPEEAVERLLEAIP